MQNCKNCYGKHWLAKINPKTGIQERNSKGQLIYTCFRCPHEQAEDSPEILPYRKHSSILYIDLEVSKSRVYNYGLKVPSKYIHFENLDKEYFIICWVASYVGSRKVFSDCVSPAEARRWDDSKILKELRDIMASADIIAGHNVAAYDVKRANTRFLLNDIPSVIATNDKDKRLIDTLKIARSKFAFESNTLDYINQRLGFRPKDDIRNEDWLKIIKTGDEKTLNKVSRYCKGDVVQGKRTLERLMQYGGRKVNYGVTW